MSRIPSSFINEWFDKHPGDVFRCMQEEIYQESLDKEPQKVYPHVFITRIAGNFYVANERDIYNNGLGQFYSSTGLYSALGLEKPKKKDVYIKAYPVSTIYNNPPIFTSFYDNSDDWNKLQEMPWFEEDRFNRTKFLAEVYKIINNDEITKE